MSLETFECLRNLFYNKEKKLKNGECDRLHTQSIMVMFLFHEVLF